MAKKDFMTLMKDKTTDLKPSLLSAEEYIKSQVIMLDQLRDLIYELAPEELMQLEQNILEHGIKDPLSIWETTASAAGIDDSNVPVYILIDGHNRYRISQQHHIDFRINLMHFSEMDQVKDYMIKYQLGRRNLTPEQIAYLRGTRYNQQKKVQGSNLRAEAPQANVANLLAKEHQVSSRTIKRDGEFAADMENLPAELKKEVLAGRQKFSKAEINKLAKDALSAAGIQDESVESRQAAGENLLTSDVAQQIDLLQKRIRQLANGPLNQRSCTQLINKTKELLALQLPK